MLAVQSLVHVVYIRGSSGLNFVICLYQVHTKYKSLGLLGYILVCTYDEHKPTQKLICPPSSLLLLLWESMPACAFLPGASVV